MALEARQTPVINAGAGAAGLLMEYKMQKKFTSYELTCYGKYSKPLSLGRFILTRFRNPEVGGTWYENGLVDPGMAFNVPPVSK
jgi:hypothetical protein